VKLRPYLGSAVLLAAAFGAGMLFQQMGVTAMSKTTYLELQEPLLLHAGGDLKNFHMLPAGTALYEEYRFPEGHTQYRVYVNIKSDFLAKQIVSDKPSFTAPIWAYPVEPKDIPKLVADTPVTKEDLVRILKARKVTREELAQIVREWRD
jgi:hypothetical protein